VYHNIIASHNEELRQKIKQETRIGVLYLVINHIYLNVRWPCI